VVAAVRQVQRASIRGTVVRLSRTQFPDLYASVDDFAATLHVKPAPDVYLSKGNGAVNAFAAQIGWTSNGVVLANELFANLRNDNRDGTRRARPDLAGRRPVRSGQPASPATATSA
jgi:hypothetical protein